MTKGKTEFRIFQALCYAPYTHYLWPVVAITSLLERTEGVSLYLCHSLNIDLAGLNGKCHLSAPSFPWCHHHHWCSLLACEDDHDLKSLRGWDGYVDERRGQSKLGRVCYSGEMECWGFSRPGRQSSYDLLSSGVSVGFQSLVSFQRQLLRNSRGFASWHDPSPSLPRWSLECCSTWRILSVSLCSAYWVCRMIAFLYLALCKTIFLGVDDHSYGEGGQTTRAVLAVR